MAEIVRPGGVPYLSWRVTKDGAQRDKSGRFYAAFDGGLARQQLGGCAVLLDEESVSASSGKTIHRIIARRT
jgi:hypothetical protein